MKSDFFYIIYKNMFNLVNLFDKNEVIIHLIITYNKKKIFTVSVKSAGIN